MDLFFKIKQLSEVDNVYVKGVCKLIWKAILTTKVLAPSCGHLDLSIKN